MSVLDHELFCVIWGCSPNPICSKLRGSGFCSWSVIDDATLWYCVSAPEKYGNGNVAAMVLWFLMCLLGGY